MQAFGGVCVVLRGNTELHLVHACREHQFISAGLRIQRNALKSLGGLDNHKISGSNGRTLFANRQFYIYLPFPLASQYRSVNLLLVVTRSGYIVHIRINIQCIPGAAIQGSQGNHRFVIGNGQVGADTGIIIAKRRQALANLRQGQPSLLGGFCHLVINHFQRDIAFTDTGLQGNDTPVVEAFGAFLVRHVGQLIAVFINRVVRAAAKSHNVLPDNRAAHIAVGGMAFPGNSSNGIFTGEIRLQLEGNGNSGNRWPFKPDFGIHPAGWLGSRFGNTVGAFRLKLRQCTVFTPGSTDLR